MAANEPREIALGRNEYNRVTDCGIEIPDLSNPWVIHCYPTFKGRKAHITAGVGRCWCEPKIEWHDGIACYIHNDTH